MTGRYHNKPTLFREATRGDEAMLATIAQRTIAMCYHRFLDMDKVVEIVGGINDYLMENLGNNYCPILLLDGVPRGFAVCRDATIDLIVIDYRYQRLGLGTRLLAHCEAEMFNAYPAIALQCFEPNEQANRFFLKNGWMRTLTYNDKQIGVRTIVYQKQRSDGKDHKTS